MAFPRKYLNEGEQVVLELRPHWTFFVGPVAALAVALMIAVSVAVVPDSDSTLNNWGLPPLLLLLLAALVWSLIRYAKWTTSQFVLTSDRLIHRHGVIAKKGREIPLERLNDVSFQQSIVQRIVAAGDLLVESGGERGQQIFDHIPHPERVQNAIHRQIESAQARDADRQAGRRELSPLEQLEKLEELRQRGVISQAEFEAKKAKLLDRL